MVSSPSPSTSWIADTGASEHMTGNRLWFINFKSVPEGVWPVKFADNSITWVAGVGDIQIKLFNQTLPSTLCNVLYVPTLTVNLFSISSVTEKGYTIKHSADQLRIITKDGIVALTGKREGKLYTLDFIPLEGSVVLSNSDCPPVGTSSSALAVMSNLQLVHERLGHLPYTTIREMEKDGTNFGVTLETNSESPPFCKGCTLGKFHQQSFPVNEPRE